MNLDQTNRSMARRGLDTELHRASRRVWWKKSGVILRLVLPFCALWPVQSSRAVDPYTSEFEKSPRTDAITQQWLQQRNREAQERFRKRVAIPGAVSPEAQEAPPRHAEAEEAPLASTPESREQLMIFALIGMVGTLVARKGGHHLISYINTRYNPWELPQAATGKLSTKVLAEEESFTEFVATFRAGPAGPFSRKAQPEGAHPKIARETSEFFALAPDFLAGLRKLLQEIGKSPNEPARQTLLKDLCSQMQDLKGMAGLSDLLPVWQMASALEGLLRQLIGKSSNVSSSTLRTLASGVDLLGDLCKPGLKPDLASNPPVRLLAVDDELISRNVVSHALKKALTKPDLAENGAAALALATQLRYDVIFLDVQMPGMDGFELCTKIHETVANQKTPVVFVTCQSDFNARAQSTLIGGHDLIGKPFLTFEITVKALTLALRARLEYQEYLADRSDTVVVPRTPSPRPTETGVAVSPKSVSGTHGVKETNQAADNSTQVHVAGVKGESKAGATRTQGTGTDISLPAHPAVTMPSLPPPEEVADAFFTQAPAQLAAMSRMLKVIGETADEAARQEMVVDLYLRAHSIAPMAGAPELRAAIQIRAGLEALLKKSVANPKNVTVSTLHTAASAVNLLAELCVRGQNPELATNPPIRILVVDDDPIIRRAITGALQTAFERPESADGGKAALALAAEKPFDVIFTDVQMPGMDGFTVCAKIHETTANSQTPVVFVTSQSDLETRIESDMCGGSELIAKPFLPIEIVLKALTFAVRGRMERLKAEKPEQKEGSAKGPVTEMVS
jgi:PleD family two-component response regulator